jgi:hypothetical protein
MFYSFVYSTSVSAAKPPTGRKRIWNGKQSKLDYTAEDDDLEQEEVWLTFCSIYFQFSRRLQRCKQKCREPDARRHVNDLNLINGLI